MTTLAQRAEKFFKKHGAAGHPGASGEMETNVLDLLPIRRGHFRFESGYHGEIWLDLDQLFANPRRIAPLARELAGRLSRHHVEAVVGPLVGGAFLAQMIAAELEAQFAYAEPQPAPADDGRLYPVAYRLPNTLAPLLKGKRVAIVDDAINAGSALRGTFHALVAEGAKPAVAGALIVLSDAARPFLAANGLKLEGLVTLATPLWSPEVCPLCARQAPLDSSP